MRATNQVITAPKSENRRIFVATGITGLVRAEWAMARWNQASPVNWSKTEYLMWLDQYAPLGFLVAEARNVAVSTFLQHGFEWMVFIDHDTVIPPTFLITVNNRIIKEHVPVWSGLYFTKSVPAEPLVFRGLGNGYYADWKMGDKVWVSGVPMGCTVIHRSILQACWDEAEEYDFNGMKMRRVFETPIRMWEDPKTLSWQTAVGTEDLAWCDKVVERGIFKKAGWPEYQRKPFPFLVDTAVFCEHISPDGTRYPSQGEEKFFARNGSGRSSANSRHGKPRNG